MIVAKTQTFLSHIHRNWSLTAVLGHNSEKTLSSCTTVLGDARRGARRAASLPPAWPGAIGNRSATLSLDFKTRFPSDIWRRYTGQAHRKLPSVAPSPGVGVEGKVRENPMRQERGQASVFSVEKTSLRFCLNYSVTDVHSRLPIYPRERDEMQVTTPQASTAPTKSKILTHQDRPATSPE